MSVKQNYEIIGSSPQAEALRGAIKTAAALETPILFTGPVGSGRVHAAQVLTSLSARCDMGLTIIPCASLSASFAESELFGHEKGAFTGASESRTGTIERAEGGVVLFADIHELPEAIQPRLLRFFEDKKYRRLGGTEELTADIRILASSTPELKEYVKSGSLRADLYYRLKGLEINLPPLKERIGDITILAEYFLRMFAQEFNRPVHELTEEASGALNACSWEGNIRELQNVIKGAVVFSTTEMITKEALGLEPCVAPLPTGSLSAAVEATIAETETRMIKASLTKNAGNRTKAAEELGVSRRGLQLKMKRYNIL